MKYFLILLFFCGCYTAKKADRQLNKSYIYHKGLTAQKFSEWFPCDVQIDSSQKIEYLYKTDTLLKFILKESEPINNILIDTIKIDCKEVRNELKRAKGLIDHLTNQIQAKPIIYYRTIIDSARNVSLQNQLNQANDELKNKGKKYLISLWWIIALLIALLLSIIIRK